MGHAEALIHEVHDLLMSRYPAIPRRLLLEGEPREWFGIARFWGLVDGAARFSFEELATPEDDAPARGVVSHEMCHALHLIGGGSPFMDTQQFEGRPDPVLTGYWRAMGYTTTLEQAWATARARNDWKYWPGEQMADAFAWVVYRGQGWGGADPGIYGGSYAEENLMRLDYFFRSVQPVEGDMSITAEEWVQIDEKIQTHLREYAQRLQDTTVTPILGRLDGVETVINGFRSAFDVVAAQ